MPKKILHSGTKVYLACNRSIFSTTGSFECFCNWHGLKSVMIVHAKVDRSYKDMTSEEQENVSAVAEVTSFGEGGRLNNDLTPYLTGSRHLW